MLRITALLLTTALTFIGCESSDGEADIQPDSIFGESARQRLIAGGVSIEDLHEIDETTSSEALIQPMSLCQLVWIANGGAGLYSVAAMGSVEENGPLGELMPFTYVELERIDDWSGTAPSVLVIRMDGGYHASTGATRSTSVGFRDGDVYGVMWASERDDFNGGFAFTYGPLVFSVEDGIVRPEQPSVPRDLTTDQFGEIVRETYAALPEREYGPTDDILAALPSDVCPLSSRAVVGDADAGDREESHVDVPVEEVPVDE